ncbi:RidA family protein [Anderseniella sp. Alg231-50]|uniref:RidA family protein n=1 Tax=Anderseniella sp. Alg231-50 TaxID=1922226 RepID=UPI00307C151F
MLKRLAPDTIRKVPQTFQKIYSHAVEITAAERLLFMAGQIGVAPDGKALESFDEQCHQAMANVEALLSDAGMTQADMLRVTYYLTNAEDLPSLGKIRNTRWGSDQPPAVTTLVVAALAAPELLVEIEVVAGI